MVPLVVTHTVPRPITHHPTGSVGTIGAAAGAADHRSAVCALIARAGGKQPGAHGIPVRMDTSAPAHCAAVGERRTALHQEAAGTDVRSGSAATAAVSRRPSENVGFRLRIP